METNSNLENFEQSQPMPNNNMTLAIIATVISCLTSCWGGIIGIVAIIFANQVKTKYNNGDIEGAEKSAKNAKILAYVAIAIGVILLIYQIATFDEQMEKFKELMEQYKANQ